MNKENEKVGSGYEEDLARAEASINSDKPLTPELISSLLHIEVPPSHTLPSQEEKRSNGAFVVHVLALLFASVSLAVLVCTVYLYVNDIGPFNQVAEVPEF